MKFPEHQRRLHQDEYAKRLRMFSRSLESGKMADLRRHLNEKIDSLTKNLVQHLKSVESINRATKIKRLSTDMKMADLVSYRLGRTICTNSEVQRVSRDVDSDLGPGVDEEIQRLKSFRSEFSTVPSPFAENDVIQTSIMPTSNYAKIIAVGAILSPFLVLAPFFLSTYLILRYVEKSKLRQPFKTAYEARVAEICSEPLHELRECVKNAVAATSPTARIVFESFQVLLKATEQDLAAAQARQARGNEEEYRRLLKNCQKKIGRASAYILHLGIHNYTGDDITHPGPPTPGGEGSFATVHKVKLAEKEKVALKVFKCVIDENNAQVFLREFATVRLVQNSLIVQHHMQVCF